MKKLLFDMINVSKSFGGAESTAETVLFYYLNPLCILNNANFNIINISIKNHFINVLYNS